MLYPIKFEKIFKEKVWGGRNLEDKLGISIPNYKKIGESWEISSRLGDISVVENGHLKGKTLQELLEEYKEILVGEKVYNQYGNKFPLLIKYLDINDRLSIQVHPDNDYALKYENELGKSESWYVIHASDNAKLIMGTKDGVTKDIFKEKTFNNDFKDLFNIVDVKTGDFIDVNPGLVHASVEGEILIAEIQQNSDITYRIYDFDREVNGQKRELHLDKALEVIKFDLRPKIIKSDNTKNQLLTKKEFYSIEKIYINDEIEIKSNSSFVVLSILDGTGQLKWSEGEIDIKKGETILIPCGLDIDVNGSLEVLKSYL